MRAAAIPMGVRLGRYEVVRYLATGGMAEIYLARSGGIGDFERYVVVKVIAGERRGNDQFVRMFLDEARLAAGLHHANIAQVYDVGEDDGEFFYAMEYVHGDTVRSLLEECGQRQIAIPLEVAVAVAIAAASGLHHAHDRESGDGRPLEIVHRDVSPSNVMVGYDGAVKVLDFGIARASERATETESGVVKGKYAYMAPEQCRAQHIDRRADVFALGIVLYELSTQHRAFKSDSDFETMTKIVGGEVAPPSSVRASYPPALEAIVARAMAVDPAHRYQTAAELGDALEAFAEGAGLTISQRAVERFMHQVFGTRPEPWRVGPQLPRSAGGSTPRPGTPNPGSRPSAQRAALTPPPSATPAPMARPVAPLPRTDSMVASAIQVPMEPPGRSLTRPLALGLGLAVLGVLAAVVASSGGRGGGGGGGGATSASTSAGSSTAPSAEVGAAAAPTVTAPTMTAPATTAPTTTAPTMTAPTMTAPTTPSPDEVTPAAPEPAPPPTAATVTLHLVTDPPGAAVYVGTKRRGATPLDLTVPRGARPLAVRFERAGWRAQTVAIPVDQDGARTVTLVKKAAPKPRGGGGDDTFTNPFAK
ncbi:MAG: serine/threonine protein kinase [Myxococcales bacterium]|nr:serine/threonine protein kinase [Myxococcales bacterium]